MREQFSIVLTDDQHKKIDSLLTERKKRDPLSTKSDVVRHLIDLGLHRENKRRAS